MAAETEARTIGAYARFPYADPGRDLDKGNPIYGVPPIPAFPFDGSAIVEWDIGPPRKINGKDVGTYPAMELLDKIRLLLVKKRGPKKMQAQEITSMRPNPGPQVVAS